MFIGPVNSAGQGFAWARAAERLDGVAAADFMYRNPSDPFAFPADHSVPTTFFRSSEGWQRDQRRAVARRFTHVLLESGRHLFGTEGTVLQQIDGLRARGVTVGLLWHGSDIRLPSEHARREPDSPFIGGRYHETDRLEEIATRNGELIAVSAAPSFVSTPDLLHFVPGASWLPVVIDVARWRGAGPVAPLTRARPVVVHAPSNAGLKGSELIAPVLERLHGEGVVEYRPVSGVPSAAMPEIYGAADIVLDQFSLGIYGVAACEAMAAGRIVVSHVGEETRAHVRRTTGLELPIVEASAGELEGALRTICGERARFSTIAEAGPAFVEAVHDGRRSAAVLAPFLGVSTSVVR
ncbi:hypothetical protein ROT00_09300 [Agromyces mediolanus]|uniref:hypothetical protein n=1 Tax=Agromyces mediolanus TaxID=41986 RepID=UPI003838A653